MLKNSCRRAFSFLEVIFVIVLSSSLILTISNFIFATISIKEKTYIKNQIFHNLDICMKFFEFQIRNARSIKLTTQNQNSLYTLTLVTDDKETLTFKFNINSFSGNNLVFSTNNELGRYIKDIKINLDQNLKLLHIKILSEEKIKDKDIEVDPINIYRIIELDGKIIL